MPKYRKSARREPQSKKGQQLAIIQKKSSFFVSKMIEIKSKKWCFGVRIVDTADNSRYSSFISYTSWWYVFILAYMNNKKWEPTQLESYTWYPTAARNTIFRPFRTAIHYVNLESSILKMETECISPCMTPTSERVAGQNSHKEHFKMWQFFPKSSNIPMKDEQDEIIRCEFHQKVLKKVIWQWNFFYNRFGF